MKRGDRIGDAYTLVSPLGQGSMGAVWSATHGATGKKVAIKLLHHRHTTSAGLAQRLFREARIYGRIAHPNVVEVIDVGVHDGLPYLVMPLLRGEGLDQRVKYKGRLAASDAAKIGAQIAAALQAAHACGVVHRDLKPANVYLHVEPNGDEIVKLLDFGLSKVVLDGEEGSPTVTGAPLGSPAYMAPEQIRDARSADARADLWSFGATLFEMLAGVPPFGGRTITEILQNTAAGPIPRLREYAPSAPAELDALVARCLVRDRAARPASADELTEALAPFVAERPSRVGIDAAKLDAIAAFDDAETIVEDEDGETMKTTRPIHAALLASLPGVPKTAPKVQAFEELPTRVSPPKLAAHAPIDPGRRASSSNAMLLGVAVLCAAIAFAAVAALKLVLGSDEPAPPPASSAP